MASAAQPELQGDREADISDDLAPGTQLLHGQYTIESFLNAGGFGITYRAVDSLDRKVVIKECFPGAFCRRSRTIVQPRSRTHKSEFDGIVRLFVQEARSLSKLQHPNIVGVHQVFEENDTAYMALDFVEGRDLLEIMEDPNTELPPSQIVSILRDILDAVGFVHNQNMLHRDISPDNILVDGTGKPVLIDFGAARQQAQKQSRVLSAMRVVKDGYSPQEFYITGSDQGPFSDLYALGASFYHLITGDVPPDSQRRLTAIATSDPDPYKPLVGRFPEYDDRVLASIDRALAILPQDRMQSAAQWLAAMDGEEPIEAPVAPAKQTASTTQFQEEPKKSRVGLVASVAGIAIAAVLGVVATQTDLLSTGAPADTGPTELAAAETEAPLPTPGSDPELDASATDTAFAAGTSETGAESASTEDIAAPAGAEDDATVTTEPEAPLVVEEQPPLVVIEEEPAPATETATVSEDISSLREGEDGSILLPTRRPSPSPEATPETPIEPDVEAIAQVTQVPNVPDEAGVELEQQEDGVAPGWTDLTAISTVPPGEEIDTGPTLAGGWSVALPFPDLRIDADGRSYVVALDGDPITDRASFDAALRAENDLESLDTLTLQIGIGQPGQAPSLIQELTLPIVHDVVLADGTVFRSERVDGTWTTSVLEVGASSETDLQPGDIVFASVDAGVRLEGPTDMRDLLEGRLSGTRQIYSFAVLRNGSNWVASLTPPETD